VGHQRFDRDKLAGMLEDVLLEAAAAPTQHRRAA
jgi:hypothetical protein